MNYQTRMLFTSYLIESDIDKQLDWEEKMDLYEAMEDQVWRCFEDLENENYEALEARITRIRWVYYR